ncbi:MAG: adenylate [Geobacteraceae bacterium]|nr:MAG: adenylate [Geobacteraceae bacterium]
MKKNFRFYIISLLSFSFFALLQILDPPLIREHIESKTYDLRLQLRNLLQPQPPADSIVIVTVDEKSLARIGRWPWSRSIMALLVDKIAAGMPRVIGLDIMFNEKEDDKSDDRLAAAIRDSGNVVLATAFMIPKEGAPKKAQGNIPDFLWDSAFMQVKTVPGIAWKKWAVKPVEVIPPIEKLARAATLGHVATLPDMDGELRWEILSVNLGDDSYPSFSLQVARIAEGVPMKDMILHGGSGIKLGNRLIPTDLSGRALINYLGGEHSFAYFSASEVLDGNVGADVFLDRIVLVGTSALGTYDQKVTPFSANMPGVEKNANVVRNILRNNFIRKSPGIIELVTTVITSLLLILALPRLKATYGVILGFGLMGFYTALSCYLLFSHSVWANLVAPVSNMAVILTVETITKLFFEEKRAREIRAMFSSYVSPKIVEALISNPEKTALGGERRTVTILFSDIIGFTTLSEKMPPEEVVTMLNEYYKEMAEIIFYWDGTLDKFVGDEIMAIWGAPTDQPDHAERALRCAFHMSDRLDQMQEKWRAGGNRNIDCGIGINTGEVVIGNIGIQGKKMDYTAIGNHVNIAARVEKLNREYGSRILTTGNTYENLKPVLSRGAFGHVTFTEHEPVKVRGKEEDVRIFAVKPLKVDDL